MKNQFNKEQKIAFCYPNLRGVDFSNVKFGSSGKPDTPEGYFASDIDGDWYFSTSQMAMLFKAFSKDKFESGLKLLIDKNSINFGDVLQKNGFRAWEGDGFQIEHAIFEGTDVIIITNESVGPIDVDKLRTTSLAPEVDLPDGYKNIGIEHVYDGDKFLKANSGSVSLNIPLLFKDQENGLNYIIIGVTTLTLAKKIIDDIIEKNYGKTNFKKLEDQDDWEYIYHNKFFSIGFMKKHFCVRINMLHNLRSIY